jgi:Translation initiation factor eIF3 subunit
MASSMGTRGGKNKANKVQESWEDMLTSSSEDDISTHLSEDVRRKMQIEQEELDYNYEAACELMGVPPVTNSSNAPDTSAASGFRETAQSSSTAPTSKVIASMQKKPTLIVLPSHTSASTKSHHYSLDSAQPRTTADYSLFRQNLIEKILNVKNHATVDVGQAFMQDLMHDLMDNLSVLEVKKLVSWAQTLYNKKMSSASHQPIPGGLDSKKKPALKYGGSMKSGFDHGLKQESDFDDDDYY